MGDGISMGSQRSQSWLLPRLGRCASLAMKFELVELALWAAIVATVDLVPVRVWGSVSVSMSFPVALAAGMIFPPVEAALIAFAGSFDPRELKGGVSLAKAVFNRSQVAASVMAGSVLFHSLGGDILDWPEVLLPGLAALLADAGVNFILVASAVAVEDRMTPRGVLRGCSVHRRGITWLATFSWACSHFLSRQRSPSEEFGLCCSFLPPSYLHEKCFVRHSMCYRPPSASVRKTRRSLEQLERWPANGGMSDWLSPESCTTRFFPLYSKSISWARC